jgi:serine/threonine-protein kinase
MGAIWQADHLTLGMPCAVKFITEEATNDPPARARFQVEATTLARLHSRHVVRVFDYGVYEDVPYIALELLRGEDLGERLARVGRLGLEATYRIVSQIARGLSRAHAAGIVHRDLKPENVFLAHEDGEEIVKLLDFGIVKSMAPAEIDGLGEPGGLCGTPEYMSPEQAKGVSEVDHRSDLWALAVIVYECLTGTLPFDAPSLSAVLTNITSGPIPVPSQQGIEGIPSELDAWWRRATSRDVRGRFQSAEELADALGKALGMIEVPAAIRRSQPPRPPLVPRDRPKPVMAALLVSAAAALLMLFGAGHDGPTAHAAPSVAPASGLAASPVPPPALLATVQLAPPAPDGAAAEKPTATVAKHDRAPGSDAPPTRRPKTASSATSAPALQAPPHASSAVPPRPIAEVDFGI